MKIHINFNILQMITRIQLAIFFVFKKGILVGHGMTLNVGSLFVMEMIKTMKLVDFNKLRILMMAKREKQEKE